MQRKEFENRIKSLLPKAADDVVESWAEYATELDQDGTEAAADFYDKNYIALLLVKQRRGEEIATQLFNFGKRFTFNYFELQGAAEKLEAGWSLDDTVEYTVENGCDATPEEQKAFWDALPIILGGRKQRKSFVKVCKSIFPLVDIIGTLKIKWGLKHRMKRNRKATHIQWDVDEPEDMESLPTEIDIPDGMTDIEEISDYITDQTGFCHNGFIVEG